MKKFYYTEHTKQERYSQKKLGCIYKLTKGDLEFCCEYTYSTGSCRGAKSEVFRTLVANKFIPKKWLESDRGYFFGEVTEHYQIKEV